jgi:glycosyltransferase XagB
MLGLEQSGAGIAWGCVTQDQYTSAAARRSMLLTSVPTSDAGGLGRAIARASLPLARSATEKCSQPVDILSRVLRRLNLADEQLAEAADRALRHSTSVDRELLAARAVTETAYYQAIAAELGLAFIETIDPHFVIVTPSIDALLIMPHKPLVIDQRGRTCKLIAPDLAGLVSLAEMLSRHGGLRPAFAITTPSAVRHAVWAVRSRERVAETVGHLFDTQQTASARIVATGSQGFVFGTIFTALAALLIFSPVFMSIAAHLFLTTLFATLLWLRATALIDGFGLDPEIVPADAADPTLPVYTVMVALYREHAMAGQLVRALDAIDWPRAKLDIKFVCEANDPETIAALRAQPLGPEYEIVLVPRVHPHTKPKALNYAMAGARGEHLVIYDAEDRPHPAQLLQALARFRAGGPKLGCVQAPLVIANPRHSWITALFALEYAVLFRGLLPFLARNDLPLPLGGTSNHFRTATLREVGAWDPFNVTEDADLGFRLATHGHRLGVISLPTLESAPTDIRTWRNQRTRWFKGWMQTWLVMLRRPRGGPNELGLVRSATFQIMTIGLLVAALLSPAMVYFFGFSMISALSVDDPSRTGFGSILFVADITILTATFACFVLLGQRAMSPLERLRVGWRWMLLPVYWALMTWAAWTALYELLRRPHHWAKTPHRPTSAATGAAIDSTEKSLPAACPRDRHRIISPKAR